MRILDETSQVLEYSRRLEEKSRELEEATRELQRTNVRLTELDRMKDEFVSTVSHELRTPLSSIRAFSEILQDEPEMDPRQRQELSGIVVQETQRLTRLVEQIMDFTKIEAGPDSWGHENLDLVGVVNEAIAATSQLSRNRNMEVVCELPDGPVAVVGDRDRLLQVVINLLSNALKYCEPGVGRVHLSLTPLPGEVRVEVADNGPGIRPEEHERIFEKFHQIRSAATGKPQGAGLGLAICKTIIEGHGGRIWVESQPGSGARFIFTLPRGSEGGAPGAEAARASLLAGLLAFSILVAPGAAAGAGGILAVGIRGPISPSVAEHVERAVGAGRERQVSLLVIELDTPGGLDASMRVITQAILNAPYPVAVYVAPSGARAASAGTFITLAADVAAMAPGTTIGAAHPVNLIGGGDATTTAKAVSDSAAYARSLAERHGRNGDWAEKAVRDSASLTETQALKEKVIDLVAPDLDGLLSALEGRELQRPEGTVVLHTRGKPVARLPMDWRRRVLDWLSDPTIAYLLLMLGLLGIFFELSHPGVILPGVVGVISLILAFYALQSLPVSGAGLLLILLALILFFAELQVVSHGILGLGGVIALTLGSVMLVRSPAAWLRVSFFAIVPMVAATSLFFLVVLRLALKARRRPASTGREGMVGAVGEALEDLAPAGNVFVHGETWGARSPETVRKGDRVRVTAVRGLTLEVRKDREE
jgi:membrane-bound serine protease (ClpP class)